jgi:hypothetical protein
MSRSKSFAFLAVTAVLSILASAVVLAARPPANGQIATAPGAHPGGVVQGGPGSVKTVMITGDIQQALIPQIVYTVPGGYFMTLTDIILVNYNNTTCDTVISNGQAYLTSEIRTPANGQTALNLRTGLFIGAGKSISMVTDERLPGDGACTPTFTLIGTLTKNTTAAAVQ